MTCRHADDDPTCTSYSSRVESARRLVAKHEGRLSAAGQGTTPDAERFQILEAQEVGNHLVLKVQYPNCAKCSFEGIKVIVFLNTPARHALL